MTTRLGVDRVVAAARSRLSLPRQRELDHFVLMSRDSVRRLLSTALLTRDGDPSQFALWGLVFVAVPPSMYAFRQLLQYSALKFQTAAVIDKMIQVDRTFFLLYGMLIAALVAALMWEALLPDRADQEVVASLPVHARTFAAARLAAALWLATVAACAVNAPAAVLLALAAPSHPALGFAPVVLVAHLIATIGASLFTFGALLLVRAAVALGFGAEMSERLATVVQLITIAVLAEVFFFIPGVIPVLIEHLMAGDRTAMLFPSTPFAALYAWLVGARYPSLGMEAVLAPVSLLVVLGLAAALYLWPARRLARRALETLPRTRAGLFSSYAAGSAHVLPVTPPVVSMTVFTIATLLRSRPHRLVVSGYLGLALAAGTLSLIAGGIRGTLVLERPGLALLSLPLMLIFFATSGLRAAFAAPADLEANWTFRLVPPALTSVVHATGLAIMLLAIVPIGAATGVGLTMLGWTGRDAAAVTALDLLCGWMLIEFALRHWAVMPFTCGRAGDVEAVKSRWLGQIVPFLLFVWVNAATQRLALRSDRAIVWYVAVVAAIALFLHVERRLRARSGSVTFDAAPSDAMATLSLSEALN